MPVHKKTLEDKLAADRLEFVLENLVEQTTNLPDHSLHWDATLLLARLRETQRQASLGLASGPEQQEVTKGIRAEASRLIRELPDDASPDRAIRWLKNPPALRYRDVAADRPLCRQVWQNLHAGHFIIHGTGGMGKTTLAKLMVGEYGRRFDGLAWLEAVDGLPSVSSVVETLHSYEGKRKLLVVDDLQPEPEQIVQLEQLQERLPGWRILVTTRGQFAARGFGILPQPLVPSLRQAQRIFQHHLYPNATLGGWLRRLLRRIMTPVLPFPPAELNGFFRETGCNTLALEMTAKTLHARSGLTLADFRLRLKDKHLDDRELEILVQSGYLKKGERAPAKITAFKCLCVAFEQAPALDPSEQRLLKILTLLPPLGWQRGRLVHDLGLDAAGDTRYVNAENALLEKGWLEWDVPQLPWWKQFFARREADPSSHYRLHPLVRQMLHYLLRPGAADVEPLLDYLDKHTESKLDDYLRWWMEATDYLVEHDQTPSNPGFWAENLLNLGDRLDALHLKQRGLAYCMVAEQIFRKLASEEPLVFEPLLAKTQHVIGRLYKSLHHFPEAETFCQAALQIRQRLAAADPIKHELDLSKTQHNLGGIYDDLYLFDRAEAMLLSALDIRRRLVLTDPKAVEFFLTTTLDGLGNVYSQLRRFEDAEKMYLECLEIRRRLSQEDPARFEPELATSQTRLAILYDQDLKRHEEAEELFMATLEILNRFSIINPERFEPDLATLQYHLGTFCNNCKRFEEAEQWYNAALLIYKRWALANPEQFDPNLGELCGDIGFLYLNLDRYQEALEMFDQAIEIFRRFAAGSPLRFNIRLARLLVNQTLLYQKLLIGSGAPDYKYQALGLLSEAGECLLVYHLDKVPEDRELLARIEALEAWFQQQDG